MATASGYLLIIITIWLLDVVVVDGTSCPFIDGGCRMAMLL